MGLLLTLGRCSGVNGLSVEGECGGGGFGLSYTD